MKDEYFKCAECGKIYSTMLLKVFENEKYCYNCFAQNTYDPDPCEEK